MARTTFRSLLALLLLAACSPADAKDIAVPKDAEWDSTSGPPPWIDAASPNPEAVRGVVAAQSNLLGLVGSHPRWLSQSIIASLAWRLRPVLGAEADAILDLVLPTTPTKRRAYHLTPPRHGDESVVGAQTYTVWTLWEVPMALVLEKVPEAKRDAARKALLVGEPAGVPAWAEVKAAPPWAAPAAATAEVWSVTVETSADRADVARAQSVALSGERVEGDIVERLRPVLGGAGAWSAASRAATWRRCTHRGATVEGDRPTAWARFEVPTARILEAVPEGKRDEARTALLGTTPK